MRALALARERLLVVEDEPLIALDIECLLEKEGAIVFSASSVSRAIRLVEMSSLSAGVVDFRLGEDDAEPVCEALAQRQVPFVFYTGQFETRDSSRDCRRHQIHPLRQQGRPPISDIN